MCGKLNCIMPPDTTIEFGNAQYNICRECWGEFSAAVCCFYNDEDLHLIPEKRIVGLLDQFMKHDRSIVSFERLLKRRYCFILDLLKNEYIFNFLYRTFPFDHYTDVLLHHGVLTDTRLECPSKHSLKVELYSNNKDFIFTISKYGIREWVTQYEVRHPIINVNLN